MSGDYPSATVRRFQAPRRFTQRKPRRHGVTFSIMALDADTCVRSAGEGIPQGLVWQTWPCRVCSAPPCMQVAVVLVVSSHNSPRPPQTFHASTAVHVHVESRIARCTAVIIILKSVVSSGSVLPQLLMVPRMSAWPLLSAKNHRRVLKLLSRCWGTSFLSTS